MASEWKESTIGEEVLLQRGFDITKAEQVPGPVPVISSSGISSFHTIAKVSAPGVILGRKGVVGSVYYIDEDFWPHDTTLWVKNFKGNVPKFVYYYFRWQAPLLASMDVGSANPTLNRNHVHPIRTSWPSLAEQQRVAEVLTALDDKIELNRKTNQTLESMAQALFKSWFVDFDPIIDNALAAGHEIPEPLAAKAAARRALREQGTDKANQPRALPDPIRQLLPSRFQFTEELGWIPEGWDVSTVGEAVQLCGGGTPSTKNGAYWTGGVHAFCTPKDMSRLSGTVLMDTERKLTDEGLAQISSGLLPTGTVLMSSRAPIGYLAINDIPVSVNQGIIAMMPHQSFSPLYLLLWAKSNLKEIENRANGSTFQEISKKNFRGIPMVVPGTKLLSEFGAIASELRTKMETCEKQISVLTRLRDELIPKLLSGELRIPETEKMLDEALA